MKYRVEISGNQPATAETLYRRSAYNAAETGLEYRAEPGATAQVTSLSTGRLLRAYATNERGDVYEM